MRDPWRNVQLEFLSAEEREALRWRARLSDFFHRDRLVGVCQKCGRAKVFVPYALRKRHGDMRIGYLEERMRCGGCGARGTVRMFLAEQAED